MIFITFWCTLIRKQIEFASSAIENVSCTDFSLIRIAKKVGVDTGVRITEGPLYVHQLILNTLTNGKLD